eukprot:1601329-Pleurochrysis_carterae.AAC.2
MALHYGKLSKRSDFLDDFANHSTARKLIYSHTRSYRQYPAKLGARPVNEQRQSGWFTPESATQVTQHIHCKWQRAMQAALDAKYKSANLRTRLEWVEQGWRPFVARLNVCMIVTLTTGSAHPGLNAYVKRVLLCAVCTATAAGLEPNDLTRRHPTTQKGSPEMNFFSMLSANSGL